MRDSVCVSTCVCVCVYKILRVWVCVSSFWKAGQVGWGLPQGCGCRGPLPLSEFILQPWLAGVHGTPCSPGHGIVECILSVDRRVNPRNKRQGQWLTPIHLHVSCRFKALLQSIHSLQVLKLRYQTVTKVTVTVTGSCVLNTLLPGRSNRQLCLYIGYFRAFEKKVTCSDMKPTLF